MLTSKNPHYIFCEDKYTPKKDNMTEEQITALHEIPTVEDIQEFVYNFYECGQFRYLQIFASLLTFWFY